MLKILFLILFFSLYHLYSHEYPLNLNPTLYHTVKEMKSINPDLTKKVILAYEDYTNSYEVKIGSLLDSPEYNTLNESYKNAMKEYIHYRTRTYLDLFRGLSSKERASVEADLLIKDSTLRALKEKRAEIRKKIDNYKMNYEVEKKKTLFEGLFAKYKEAALKDQ